MTGAGDPDIRVVRGEPTAEELAALLAVWAGAGAAAGSAPGPPGAPYPPYRRSRAWARGADLRTERGPGLWRRGGRAARWTP
ncbi:acyl-CoA carboxylase epsilon subunit [Actinacidiphila alni]|uniref:acyl-CoA carboxylase epsilon subunit n=1 Tax=Actinacidiphila alni TaxID=380248 RepID=UPI003408D8E6